MVKILVFLLVVFVVRLGRWKIEADLLNLNTGTIIKLLINWKLR